MTKEDKDILLRLLQQHKELGISEQIDYQKHYLDSLISNSVALSDLSPEPIDSESLWQRNWSIFWTLWPKRMNSLQNRLSATLALILPLPSAICANSPSLAIWRHMVEIRTEHIANSSSSGK